MKKILAILSVALMIGCNDSNTKEPQASLSTDPDSTFLPNGYDMTDIFKTRTGHITTTIDVNGKPCVFLIAWFVFKKGMRLGEERTPTIITKPGHEVSHIRAIEKKLRVNGW